MKEATQHYVPTEERRSEIACAARAIIAEVGFEGLRTRDIAERVGINIATLHYHVPSKAALVQLLAESLRDDFMEQHARHPREGLNPLQRLELEFSEFEEVQRDKPELHVVLGELMGRTKRDSDVADVIQPLTEHWFGSIEQILRDGVSDGVFRADLDPQAGAAMVIGTLTWRGRSVRAFRPDLKSVTAELLRSLLGQSG